MTATDMTTDEIAAAIRQRARLNPAEANLARPIAKQLTDTIKTRLPNLDETDVAAVLMHTGKFIVDQMKAFRAAGADDGAAAHAAVNAVAIAGVQLDRRARRGQAEGA